MAGIDAGVVGSAEIGLNTGVTPDGMSNSGAIPRPAHAAFWTHAWFIAAVLFLLVTYHGGFRRFRF